MYSKVAGAGEVLAVLVEWDGHHSVSRVERFLDSVAMMNVDVQVKYALMIPVKSKIEKTYSICNIRVVVYVGKRSRPMLETVPFPLVENSPPTY